MAVFDRLTQGETKRTGGVFGRLTEPVKPEKPTFQTFVDQGKVAAPTIDVRQTPIAQASTQAAEQQEAQEAAERERINATRKGRDLPVIGPVLRGLDAVADNPVVQKAGEIGRSLYTPGAGLANVAGFMGATGTALNRAAPRLGNTLGGRVAQEAIKEGVVGIPLGTGQALSSQTTDLGEAAQQGLIGGALGAAGGAAAAAVGPRLSSAVSKWFQRKGIPDQATEVLALPEPRQQATDVPLGLPEPNVLPATRARVERQVNPYRQQFESLIERAKQLESEGYFTPGREDVELESLWSQMAGKDAPNLDHLIDLAYPKSQPRVQPGMMSQARQYQQSRQTAGVPLPVRTMDERYASGPVASAAQPLTKIQRTTPELPRQQAPELEPMRISAFGKSGKYTNPEDTRTYIATKTEREPVDIPNLANQFYAKNVDNLQRINQLDKYVEKVTGKKLRPQDRAYMLALNQRGADMTARHILTERLVDSKGNAIGQSLKDITKQIPRRSYTNFNDYLIAKHAQTRMARGETVYDKRTNMTPEKVQEKLAEYERTYPAFKEISDQLYEWNDRLGKAWLVDTGIISPDMWDAWKKANPYWVPNQRKFTALEKSQRATGAKRGFGNQNNPVKRYSPDGSERPIIDPIESLIEYTDRYVKTARRNEVMQAVVRNLLRNPDELDGFGTVLRREKIDPRTVTGEEGIDGLMSSIDAEWDKALKKSDLDKDNVISALVDGDRVYVRFQDPMLLEALTNLTPQGRNAVIEMSRKASNAVKLLTTGINPIFSLTRNIWKDIPAAYIFSKTTDNPFRFAVDMLDGIVSTLGNKELYQRYKAMGGGHSSAVAADRNLLAQSRRELLPQQSRGLGLLPRLYHGIENLSNVIESAPRLGEFKRITKAGGDTYDSRIRGLYEAQDVTTNFKRHGTVAKEADAVFLYLNAAIQGLDKFARAFKDNPKAVASKAALAITVPTVGLYALNHNNPEYKKLSNYTKDNFFMIPTGNKDNSFIKIPKPRELGVPFSSMLERTMRAWAEEDPEAFRDFSETVTNAFVPPGIPAKEVIEGDFADAAVAPLRDTIAGPLVDVASNENFMGAPIVPGYLEGLSPRLQFDANTSEVSKKVGDVLNVSPKQIDHLVRGYTGVIGQVGIPATAQGSTIGGTLAKQMTADPVFSTDATGNFYELKDKIDMQYRDAKQTGKIPPGYDDNVRKLLNRVADQMSDYTKAIREIDKQNLSDKEKQRWKRELTEQRNALARNAYNAARQATQAK